MEEEAEEEDDVSVVLHGDYCEFVPVATSCIECYVTEYELPSLSGGACTVFTHDTGLQDGNTGNGEATGQVYEVTNDGNLNEVGLEFRKEAPSSYANKLSPTPLNKAIL
ncbi:hypothetical protein Tco_0326648 [Tanacetum coccineum]